MFGLSGISLQGVVEVEEAGRFSALLQETSRGFTPLRLHEVSPRALVQRRPVVRQMDESH